MSGIHVILIGALSGYLVDRFSKQSNAPKLYFFIMWGLGVAGYWSATGI
jgi:F0F1-type ATP synthase assembly protein I